MKIIILVTAVLFSSSCVTGEITTEVAGKLVGVASSPYQNGLQKTLQVSLGIVELPFSVAADVIVMPFSTVTYNREWTFGRAYKQGFIKGLSVWKPYIDNIYCPDSSPFLFSKDSAIVFLKETFTQGKAEFKKEGILFLKSGNLIIYKDLNLYAFQDAQERLFFILEHNKDSKVNKLTKHKKKYLLKLKFIKPDIAQSFRELLVSIELTKDKGLLEELENKRINAIRALITLGVTRKNLIINK